MWVHMHPVHIPVHPLNYSFNVYQVLAVNSLSALFTAADRGGGSWGADDPPLQPKNDGKLQKN